MKKKIMITVASIAALGAVVAGYLHFSGRGRLLAIAISAELWYCSA